MLFQNLYSRMDFYDIPCEFALCQLAAVGNLIPGTGNKTTLTRREYAALFRSEDLLSIRNVTTSRES